MNLNELLIKELKQESENTRKILQCVPEEQIGWKPHEKSFTLGRLATHVAELPHWMLRILNADDFDMQANPYQPHTCQTQEELIAFFDQKLKEGMEALEKAANEQLQEEWIFRRGEHVIFKSTRYEAIRSWMFNHQFHHRGQLSVYLRLLDIPIPGMYGPSADDIIARQKAAAAQQ